MSIRGLFLLVLFVLPVVSRAQVVQEGESARGAVMDSAPAISEFSELREEDVSLKVNLLDDKGQASPIPQASDEWEDFTAASAACNQTSLAIVGTKLWQLLTGNVSISESSVRSMVAHVLPDGVREPRELSSFPSKKVQKLEVILLNNILGVEMFKVVVQVSFDYGASYRGTGKYLANLTMIPVEVKAFAAKGDVKAEVLSAVFRPGNVAALTVVVKSEVRGALDKIEKAFQFEARGNGELVYY